MKALLIAPYLYPHENPRAHRWTELGAELAASGWKVSAITANEPGRTQRETHRGIAMHRVGHHSLKGLLAYGNSPSPATASGKWRWINRHFVRSWYWPDDAWIWHRPALRQAHALLQQQKFDLIISTALPFTAHRVAAELKQAYPALCWLADTGDPFSLQNLHPLNNTRLYQRRNRKAEERVLQMADAFTVPNESMRTLYARHWPNLEQKLSVLPPLWSASPASSPTIDRKGRLVLGYFGSFYRGVRDPQQLLQCLEQLEAQGLDWELQLFGTRYEGMGAALKSFPHIRARIYERGLLPREQVAATMQRMDALLLPGNAGGFQLPSKVVDYLASGRPILHLKVWEEDPIDDYFSNYPLKHTIQLPLSSTQVTEVLRFLQQNRNKQVPENWIQAQLDQHRAPQLAARVKALCLQHQQKIG